MKNSDIDDPRVNVFLKGLDLSFCLSADNYETVNREFHSCGAEVFTYTGIYGDVIHIRGRDILSVNFWSREAGDEFKRLEKQKEERELIK